MLGSSFWKILGPINFHFWQKQLKCFILLWNYLISCFTDERKSCKFGKHEGEWIIQYSSTLIEMFGLKVFPLQTCLYKTCKLSRAFPQKLAACLHGVNLFAFSVCPQARPPYPCYLDLLMKHTSHMTTNKQRMEPRTDVWCLAHNESRGWDEREQGRWDSGSSFEWTGLAVVSLRGICMFKATPQSSHVLSKRWLKSTSETSSVEFQIKFRKLDEVKPSFGTL